MRFKKIRFGDIDPERYRVSSDGHIYDSNMSRIQEYESTNGFNYIFLKTIDESISVLKVDFIVYSSFVKNIKVTQSNLFGICHIDGDTRNSSVDNLKLYVMNEEWRPITYIGIVPNRYMISNYGRIKRIDNDKLLKPMVDKRYGYVFVGLNHTNGVNKHEFVHRLVAWQFIESNRKIELDVNHINGVKTDNHIQNLEWIDRHANINHAFSLKLINTSCENSPKAKFSNDIIHEVCKKLLDYNGCCGKVEKFFNNEHNIPITRWTIENIKYKRQWTDISDGYFDADTFSEVKTFRSGKPVLCETDVHKICATLITNDMNIYKTYQILNFDIPYLTYSQIYKIKKKYTWSNISDAYWH